MTIELSFSASLHRNGFNFDCSFDSAALVTGVFGASGSGKTTIVDAIAGLLTPNAGRICVAGRELFNSDTGVNLPAEFRGIGYVFQEPRLFPHLTVRSNLLFSQHAVAPQRRRTANGELQNVAELLGLTRLLERRPSSLSGGERQRVAIGRALLSNPQILLMDEPLASLDQNRKSEILPFLERLAREAEIPIIYVSHDLSEIERLASALVVIDEGRVQWTGPVADYQAN